MQTQWPGRKFNQRALRKLLFGLAFFSAISIAQWAIAIAKWSDSHELTRDDFAQIERGMTRSEVLGLIGPPTKIIPGEGNSSPTEVWEGNNCRLRVFFDEDIVIMKGWTGGPPLTFLDKVLRHIPWPAEPDVIIIQNHAAE